MRPWLNMPIDGHGHVIWMGNLGGFFSRENTPEGYTETHKSSLFPYKHVSVRNGDHEWLRMTNAFILCDLLWKVQKSHTANKEGSFKWNSWLWLLWLHNHCIHMQACDLCVLTEVNCWVHVYGSQLAYTLKFILWKWYVNHFVWY